MIELIKTWLIGITCAAMVVALAESLSPQGTVRKIGKMTGGLILLLSILQPLAGWKEIDLDALMADYQLQVQEYSGDLEEENQNLMKEIIAEEAGAYIVDKAAEAGFTCIAHVETQAGEAGISVPWSAAIQGAYTGEQRAALTQKIASELNIPAERQSYEWGEVE